VTKGEADDAVSNVTWPQPGVTLSRERSVVGGAVEERPVMSSGKATNLTILRAQWSTLSSDKPTHARSGVRARTSPDVGECDLLRIWATLVTLSGSWDADGSDSFLSGCSSGGI
jgi:hypothetical protein